MEVSFNGDGTGPVNYVNKDASISVDLTKQDAMEKLKARIAELELELQKQKKAAEKAERFRNVMWGDDFNDESLH